MDSSPIAVAITASKLVSTTVNDILREARHILSSTGQPQVPEGEFWNWAYHPEVLHGLCRFRESFLEDCSTPPRIALRGIVLGALHGPTQKTAATYFSNQCPRTYAPKPGYATRFWKSRGLAPEFKDILDVIRRRAHRFYNGHPLERGPYVWRIADLRTLSFHQTLTLSMIG